MKQKQRTRTAVQPAAHTILPVETESQRLLETFAHTKEEMDAYYPAMLEEGVSAGDVQAKSDSLKRTTANLSKSLAQMYAVSDELVARWNDIKKQKRRFVTVPSNTAIDVRETRTAHFARGINLYKLLLICYVGSFLGVVVELLWCLVTKGYLESRAGLVYGPFNLLYGFGAVAMTLCLYRFRNRSSWISFLAGMLVGNAVEYLCSWLQELAFGTRSWDYSHMPFNLNGRICLLYGVFWGVLAVLWMKNIYPRMAKWILKIPNKPGKIITWVLAAAFAANAAISCAALYRYTQRRETPVPPNAAARWLDVHFPDERIEKIYANMEFSK